MAKERELREKLWRALKSDRTVMLGLAGEDSARPMTAQIESEGGPIWFFTAKDTEIMHRLAEDHEALATFASKSHDLFATLHGSLREDTDPKVIERLWNPFVAAWFEGKDDPKLALLRFDAERAEVWIDASSLMAGIKMLLGFDPKQEYRDKAGEVTLG
ncbi:pyridoxamine 5'-phosphate oxidase family protein [Aestuariivirga sp. YIM B02566]|uniref:Pyridoxamine 5'-phosphate oxidase family protein n=1 Tax=Taklimakanibacter albus TaxID=2800327 RepID=A0ACC5RD61_9HYPH|nr:pyridoxamine 5'-phosphate oxidase family protein [Aestuariivirga sp. YIM B02566]MBK1870557.1 pyridoxamine 5'-phosphate oxidase family protein [Aestuariivirga sp. YIM B02566]